jgi:hypothetical protein
VIFLQQSQGGLNGSFADIEFFGEERDPDLGSRMVFDIVLEDQEALALVGLRSSTCFTPSTS